jgi:hypothetical protein
VFCRLRSLAVSKIQRGYAGEANSSAENNPTVCRRILIFPDFLTSDAATAREDYYPRILGIDNGPALFSTSPACLDAGMKSSKMAGNLIKGNLPGVIFDGVTRFTVGFNQVFPPQSTSSMLKSLT